MCLSFDLMMYATSNMMRGRAVVLVDVVAFTVVAALSGAAVGAVLGRRS
jgi:hypothetical protein